MGEVEVYALQSFDSDGTPLMEIGDPAKLKVLVDVLSTDAVKIQPGNLILIE